ncbi:DUF72 domain-containing protein [Cognatiluteimonas profundi]|uniref:DUF72 domain-containing protein n=1 Tax=Cognatiluteimonas profundi TaxID=2594501 RepID=UPI00131B64D1|nr:DUF72 domain-containing protein [Lysobacter profundi]
MARLPAEPEPIATTPRVVDGIRVGVGGWTYAPWRDNFYPAGLVQRRELEYASRHLTAIEINGTWYGAQKPATYAKWRDETPDGFVFSVKAPMRITMARALADTGGQIDAFLAGIVTLAGKLGPIVWQFDPMRKLQLDDLARFVELLPARVDGRALRHVLDVRVQAVVDADFIALARRHGMATVFTDSTEHPSFADVTADFVYARLMGTHSAIPTGYPEAELRIWAERARTWSRGGEPGDLPRIGPAATGKTSARDVFLYFISGAKERNPAAAQALLRMLGSA